LAPRALLTQLAGRDEVGKGPGMNLLIGYGCLLEIGEHSSRRTGIDISTVWTLLLSAILDYSTGYLSVLAGMTDGRKLKRGREYRPSDQKQG